MNILLVCNGGMSTSILLNSFNDYFKKNHLDYTVKATGMFDFKKHVKNADVILIGPQISFQLDVVQKYASNKVVRVIPALDYATGNVENIINLCFE